MMSITKEKLSKILEDHRKWLHGEGLLEGSDPVRANLEGANLVEANLCRADLEGAYLRNANLEGADLKEANLAEANLCGADLGMAYLGGANLIRAYLIRANLCGADLEGADLTGADLRGANLGGAHLVGANLTKANLIGANLAGADLEGAILDKITSAKLMTCPSVGSFIGWKKVKESRLYKYYYEYYIVKLLIPEDAKRSSSTGRKCRCDKAEVLAIENLDGTPADITSVTNCNFDRKTVYEVGKMTYPDSFDNNRWNECSNGIHFFITREEAEEYII